MEPETKEKLLSSKFITGVSFLIAVLVIMLWLWTVLSQWLQDKQRVPLSNVVVSGDLQYLEVGSVDSIVRERQPVSFFELNINQAHRDIESLPWVYQASVRKQWPDTLKVYVIEQVPAANWNGDMLLNQYGGIFAARAEMLAEPLPVLFGPGGSELTALQGYKAMQGLLELTGMKIVELVLSERYAWNVKLDNGISLNLGRTEFMDRLQRFIDIYPLLKRENKPIEYVDLRYDTGVAVGWLDTDNNKEAK